MVLLYLNYFLALIPRQINKTIKQPQHANNDINTSFPMRFSGEPTHGKTVNLGTIHKEKKRVGSH